MAKLTKFIKSYPGFFLNFAGILVCTALNILYFFNSDNQIKRDLSSLRYKVAQELAHYVSNRGVSRNNRIEQMNYNNCCQEIRKAVLLLFITDKSSYLHFTTHKEDFDDKDFLKYDKFIQGIGIDKIVTNTSGDSKVLEKNISSICSPVSEKLKRDSPYIKNKKIIVLWNIMAFIYLGIVGYSYLGTNLEVDKGEPILNIIDVGLYLALIEYTGGFKSPIIWIIWVSIVIAIVDFNRLVKLIDNRYNSVSIALKKWKAFKTVFSTLTPTILYFFSLVSGLMWATIGLETPELFIWTYLGKYFLYLLLIASLGIFASSVFYLTNSYIQKNV